MGALIGVGLFVVGLVVMIVVGAAGGPTDAWWIVAPTFGGLTLVAACWPIWVGWSNTLDRADKQRRNEPARGLTARAPKLARTPKLTLWMLSFIGMGVLLFLGSGMPLLIFDDGSDGLAAVLLVTTVLGASMIGVTLAASAIAGAIALGGLRWWWVGVLFDIGFALAVWGIVAGNPAWVVGAVLLAGSAWGYSAALRAGLRQGRADAIEAKLQKDHGPLV